MGTSSMHKIDKIKIQWDFSHTQLFRPVKSIHLWFTGHCDISRMSNITYSMLFRVL